jgi:hypothetical protein
VIFLVDDYGRIAVCDARFIRDTSDYTLAALLAQATWCYSMEHASEISRARRTRVQLAR